MGLPNLDIKFKCHHTVPKFTTAFFHLVYCLQSSVMSRHVLISHFFLRWYSIVCLYHIFFLLSSVNGDNAVFVSWNLLREKVNKVLCDVLSMEAKYILLFRYTLSTTPLVLWGKESRLIESDSSHTLVLGSLKILGGHSFDTRIHTAFLSSQKCSSVTSITCCYCRCFVYNYKC